MRESHDWRGRPPVLENEPLTPHDLLALRVFGETRQSALDDHRCIRCKLPVDQAALSSIDHKEYRISALCPSCFVELTPEGD